jgi:hypothetical protein
LADRQSLDQVAGPCVSGKGAIAPRRREDPHRWNANER